MNDNDLLLTQTIEKTNKQNILNQEKIEKIVSLVIKKYPTFKLVKYMFNLFYTNNFAEKVFELILNDNETILIGFDNNYANISLKIAATFKTLSYVHVTNEIITLPIIYNVSHLSEVNMDKDFFFEDAINTFETKIQKVKKNTS